MSDIISYRLDGKVATVTFDDGKANVFSHAVIDDIHAAMNQAEKEARAFVLVGRPGKFSAGFDLSVMTSGPEPMQQLVGAGAELALRMMTFGMPTVAACTGHGLAMGGILLLAFDRRYGVDGPFKLGMNEVAIGMPVPHFAVELGRYRLTKRHFDATVLGTVYDPAGAMRAGYIDEVVGPDDLLATVAAEAARLAELSTAAVAITKQTVRGELVAMIRSRLWDDLKGLTTPQM